GGVAALLEQIASVPLWKQIVFWVGAFFIVLLLSSLLSPEMRKKLLWAVFRLGLLFLAVMYLVQNRDRFGLLPNDPLAAGGPEDLTAPETLPFPSFAAPNLPPALAYLLSLAVLLLTFGLLWLLSRGFAALRARPAPQTALKEIASAARQSLDELASGANWEDAVVRCYARMSDAVSRTRGLRRPDSMTPDEFASHLARSGLPAQAVARLTRLFESVRYGARAADSRERDEASACLNDILRYCGEAA
ncbi:MAG: DUF4129 domain-containing protein, partial [Chloroflexota bacterium]